MESIPIHCRHRMDVLFSGLCIHTGHAQASQPVIFQGLIDLSLTHTQSSTRCFKLPGDWGFWFSNIMSILINNVHSGGKKPLCVRREGHFRMVTKKVGSWIMTDVCKSLGSPLVPWTTVKPGDTAKNCWAPQQGKRQTEVVCTSTYLKEDREESPRAMALETSCLWLISYYGAREGNAKWKPLAQRTECKNQHKIYLHHCSQLSSVFKAGFIIIT